MPAEIWLGLALVVLISAWGLNLNWRIKKSMHYLCQSCQQSFPREQLFTIHKQVAGETLPMKVCSECRDKHEEDLEKTRQNFQAQFGEEAILQIDKDGKSSITPIVDIHKIIDDAMEKKDRSVNIYIGESGTSVYISPLDDKPLEWGISNENGTYTCPVCGLESSWQTRYCSRCGEALSIHRNPARREKE